ncbi:MAG: hypothetical protein DDT34_02004 [Firmicutes bacterium]|nr:hypothetical protein [Bacillota bacterium]
MTPASALATPDQIAYLKRLCVQTGKTDLQLCAMVGKTDFEALSKGEASKIIGTIKLAIGGDKRADGESPSRFPTPLAIRQLVESGGEIPKDYDEHARWVVTHTRLAVELKRLAGRRSRSEGVNRGGDIKISDLLKHFRTWDELAKAFDVTVPTAKAWGEILPAARAYEAEVKTDGFVTAPFRNA